MMHRITNSVTAVLWGKDYIPKNVEHHNMVHGKSNSFNTFSSITWLDSIDRSSMVFDPKLDNQKGSWILLMCSLNSKTHKSKEEAAAESTREFTVVPKDARIWPAVPKVIEIPPCPLRLKEQSHPQMGRRHSSSSLTWTGG